VQPVPDNLTAYQAPVMYSPPPVPVDPSPPPSPKAKVANEVRYEWEDGRADTVPVGIGYPTVVRLQPNERITSLMDGDRQYVTEEEAKETQQPQREKHPNCYYGVRWQWCRGVRESQYTPVEHLAFTATHPGHKQGVVVFTDHRTYYLELHALKATKTRLVSWTVPPPPPAPPKPKVPGLFPDFADTRVYHVGYTLTIPHATPDWTPLHIWSDPPGVPSPKMYLEFAPVILAQRMPLLRGMNEHGKPYLLNSRQYGRWLVVDELAPRLELRRGADAAAQVVVITREQLRPMQCPGDTECPVFPQG